MNPTSLHTEAELLKDEISRRLANRTLLKYTGRPIVPEPVLISLLLPKIFGEKWEEEDRLSAVAAGALYAAFSAHDSIGREASESRQGQLTVLAGDYYSGIHYRILAEVPDLRMIRRFSGSVTEMSERKIRLFEHREGEPPNFLLSSLETIEAATVSAFLMGRGYAAYEAAARHGLTAARLNFEISNLHDGEHTPFLDALLRSEGIGGDPAAAARILDRCRRFHAGRLIEETGLIGKRGGPDIMAIAEVYGVSEPASIQTGKKD
ncbi:Heptaprenyl diphosphate synthase (HEPPP synthase) subunit 1 [Bhargavaea ginsengi]|uniref:Heptaprenyl diphosphate synthase (HEPPP synthase) subunit 1 n=1 Tax=Bhargavaea ginsengi TaxID=426757 RepID=A0A1H6SBD7_9BACL|nr:heptaprenyl diphosphate synthase component 1 [Bhargavaea ginsengi]SEI65323.1 Heptaprenyl diphosphate synthase (HEPPP synthase) subunit 1 [Bhargavaea ginsengi]